MGRNPLVAAFDTAGGIPGGRPRSSTGRLCAADELRDAPHAGQAAYAPTQATTTSHSPGDTGIRSTRPEAGGAAASAAARAAVAGAVERTVQVRGPAGSLRLTAAPAAGGAAPVAVPRTTSTPPPPLVGSVPPAGGTASRPGVVTGVRAIFKPGYDSAAAPVAPEAVPVPGAAAP